MPSSSPGSYLPSSVWAHLSARVYSSFTVLGNQTFILECILRLRMLDWDTAITAAGWMSGMFLCTRLNLCMYFRKLSLLPFMVGVASRWAAVVLDGRLCRRQQIHGTC